MKLFVLGIDAGVDKVFRAFNMPFTQALLDDLVKIDIEEDLVSRGWVESYTGEHAIKTKGLYEMPMNNGTYQWSLSYNLKHMDQAALPLWELLNKRGYSVGFMNVPTTNPAPQVNGFFVCGAGGGRSLSDGFDETFCYPPSCAKTLEQCSYIVDERVPSLLWEKKLFDFKDFFDRLILMVEKRVESYLELNKTHNVDFGFLAIRAVAVVQYLAMAEIDRIVNKKPILNVELVQELERFYSELDKQIEILFKGLDPKDKIIISDHGMVPLKGTLNFNILLQELGYQKNVGTKAGMKKTFDKLRHYVPYSLRQKLKKNKVIQNKWSSLINFDPKQTVAFSLGVLPGVYINDDKRFGGIIPDSEIEDYSKKIVEEINNSQAAKKYSLTASQNTDNGPYRPFFPDILINHPETLKPISKKALMEPNPWYEKPISLSEVKDDNWTGVKGRETLFYCSNDLKKKSKIPENTDLTLTYLLIKESMSI